MNPISLLIVPILFSGCAQPSPDSFRGLHDVGQGLVWKSGTNGQIFRSEDGGHQWEKIPSPPHSEELDFRDIHAWDTQRAVVMSAGVGPASRVYWTDDGGKHWTQSAQCVEEAGFWDGIDFRDELHGWLVGDPIRGRLALWRTNDGGRSWTALKDDHRPLMKEGEYAFAASGTSLCLEGSDNLWLATGGSQSRVLRSQDDGQTWASATIELGGAAPSSGAFSIHFRDALHGIAVGGDYENPDRSDTVIARSDDGGVTWTTLTDSGVRGYRSCVDWAEGAWRVTGPTGSEISFDDGRTFHPLDAKGFHAVSGRIMARSDARPPLGENPLAENPQPNIVFFLVDDMGWQDTSVPFAEEVVATNLLYRTPSMERLATSGARFTQAYAASPVCSPTRTSILTGRNPIRSGITHWIPGERGAAHPKRAHENPEWNVDGLTEEDRTLPKALKEVGYQTAHIGKAHFGRKGTSGADPLKLGFDFNVSGNHTGHPASYHPPYGDPNHGWRVQGLDDLRNSDRYLTDALTDKALALLDTLASDAEKRPFFLHFSHYAVHTPIHADKSLLANYPEDLPGSQRAYATMIESMDTSLGRVLDRLEELGISDNTIVLFFSDNGGLVTHGGPPTQSGTLAGGKGTMREGGIRMPMLLRWPGKTTPGQSIDSPIISDDFFATLVEAGQGTWSRTQVDGISLRPLLEGSTWPDRLLFWHWPHYWAGPNLGEQFDFLAPFSSVREGDWKLTWRWDEQRAELFNLAEDIGETTDLSASEPIRAQHLTGMLANELQRWNAPLPRNKETLQCVPLPRYQKK